MHLCGLADPFLGIPQLVSTVISFIIIFIQPSFSLLHPLDSICEYSSRKAITRGEEQRRRLGKRRLPRA